MLLHDYSMSINLNHLTHTSPLMTLLLLELSLSPFFLSLSLPLSSLTLAPSFPACPVLPGVPESPYKTHTHNNPLTHKQQSITTQSVDAKKSKRCKNEFACMHIVPVLQELLSLHVPQLHQLVPNNKNAINR